jgi:hypothetical protein
MKTILKGILLSFTVAVTIAGCVTLSPGVPYSEAPQPPDAPALATIYVYRLGVGEDAYGTTDISLDGDYLSTLGPYEYTWIQVSPGTYEITEALNFMKQPLFSGYEPVGTKVEARAGTSVYVELDLQSFLGRTTQQISFVGGLPVVYPETTYSYKRTLKVVSDKERGRALEASAYRPSKAR